MIWKMGTLTFDGVPTDLCDEANIIMIDPLISAQDEEECASYPPLRSSTEYDSDEDEYNDAVAERNTEDE